MLKKLCTLLLIAMMSAPLLAQTVSSKKCDGVMFAPQKGQWQISMFFGGGNNFYNETTDYLLPTFNNFGGNVGLGSVDNKNATNGNMNQYLQINGLNNNSLTNILGLEAKYFLSDCWDINVQFSMDINLTPKKDFVEGDHSVPDMVIPAQDYISARMTNNWYAAVGTNRYFKVGNPRIHPYLGASVGFQMARIETTEPYTGKNYTDKDDDGFINGPQTDGENFNGEGSEGDVENIPQQVYLSGSRAGQMFGIKAAGVAGIEYSVAPGLVLGFQFQPLAYRYDVVQICPKGFDKYNASHHNVKIFDMPVLKLGIRF